MIVDLDGTVADLTHRLHHIQGKHGYRDYDAFYSEVGNDAPIKNIIDLTQDSHYPIVYVSGRSDECRETTGAWIKKHIDHEFTLTNPMPELYMRKQGDYRPDHIIKKEILLQMKADGYEPVIAIDDRDSICKVWVEEGITCLKHVTKYNLDGGSNSNIQKNFGYTAKTGDTNQFTQKLGKLYIMVGASGSGKSTYLSRPTNGYAPLYPNQVISSDDLRLELCGDMRDQSKNDHVFNTAHALINTRITHGLDTWFDATNIRRKDRLAVVNCVPSTTEVTYLVVERPLEDKIATGGWRNDVIRKDGKTLIEYHHYVYIAGRPQVLSGDGYPHVTVRLC